jgi:hypothetical protein
VVKEKKNEQIFVSVIFFYHLKTQLLSVDIQFMVDILHMIYFMAEDFFLQVANQTYTSMIGSLGMATRPLEDISN